MLLLIAVFVDLVDRGGVGSRLSIHQVGIESLLASDGWLSEVPK